MFQEFLISLKEILTFTSCVGLCFGSIFGIICGVLPGLSGITALVLLMPVTFFMDKTAAIVTLTAAMGAATVGGSVTSILIGVPGAGYSAATVFDGYPLAKQGRAAFALGISACASAVGAIIGVIPLIIALPIMKKLLLIMGPPEVLAITIFGVLIISMVAGRSVLNGFIAVCIGFMLSLIGFNPVLGGVRYTFDIIHLWDGLPVGPVFIGLFAISEAISLGMRGVPITSAAIKVKDAVKQLIEGIKYCFKEFFLLVQSSLIGVFIGIVPGVGGPVAAYVAYGYAKKASKDPDSFGNGDPRGVLAPETSNNAVQGGSMVPTLSFGIPGSASAAILLGALMVNGIQPGPSIVTDHLSVVFTIINIIILSNILASLLVCIFGPQLAKITSILPAYLVPVIIVVSLFGAYANARNMFHVLVAVVIGFMAYYLKKHNISIAAISIGYILGSILERNYFLTMQMGRGSFAIILQRPVTILLLLVTFLFFIMPFIKNIKKTKTCGLS